MPTEWYLMKRPLFNSGFETDEFQSFAQDSFEEVLESFIAKDVEIYEKSLSVEPVITRAIIQNVTGDVFNNSSQRQILCRIGTLRSGQYIKIDGRYWVVATLPDNNQMYEKAILWQCKYSIRFISPMTREIVEYPVYSVNSTQYGSGETQRTYMKIGTSQQLVYLPFNEETIMVECGARFLIDKNKKAPTAYRLTQVDTGSYSCGEDDGLLQWTLVESQRDEKTDNIELMVADYYGTSEISVPDPPEPGYSIVMVPDGGKPQVTFGEELSIAIEFYEDGEKTDAFPLEISITDGSEYGVLKDITPDCFVVRALKNRDFIGQEITVTAHNDDFGVSESLILSVKGWY
ncbi:MAG: hypothetical protein NC548_40365 [Lachnospiraceae bacterium]|nr:hypothetical protein [Lachnospiraceae bacterium]